MHANGHINWAIAVRCGVGIINVFTQTQTKYTDLHVFIVIWVCFINMLILFMIRQGKVGFKLSYRMVCYKQNKKSIIDLSSS